MKVLLYNSISRRYFQAPELWTDDPARAHDFEQTFRAVNTACAQRLAPVEVILAFEEAHLQDMRLPLPASR